MKGTKIFKTKKAAQYLGVSYSWLMLKIKEGVLVPDRKIGKRAAFTTECLEDFAKKGITKYTRKTRVTKTVPKDAAVSYPTSNRAIFDMAYKVLGEGRTIELLAMEIIKKNNCHELF